MIHRMSGALRCESIGRIPEVSLHIQICGRRNYLSILKYEWEGRNLAASTKCDVWQIISRTNGRF